MRRRYKRSEELWNTFLRTSFGRPLARGGVIRRMKWDRGPRLLPTKTKIWLVLLAILSLLSMALGGWIAQTTRNQKWLDDDELLLQDTIQHAQAQSHLLRSQRGAAAVKRYLN